MVNVVSTEVWLATRKPVKAAVAFVAANWFVAAPSVKLAAGKLNGVLCALTTTLPVTPSKPAGFTLATLAPVLSAIEKIWGAAAAAVPVSAIESASSEIAVGNDGARRRRNRLRNIGSLPSEKAFRRQCSHFHPP